jgi:hypothetical protein
VIKNLIFSAIVLTVLAFGYNTFAYATDWDKFDLPFRGNYDPWQSNHQSKLMYNWDKLLEKYKDIIPLTGKHLAKLSGKIGVLIYTHGDPSDPMHGHEPVKTESIKKALEKLGYPSEIITHMPYTWDEGLQKLDDQNVKYVVFLYTDLFGPKSTVIHNVTRGIFGGIEDYKYCPGVPMGPDVCMYMGEVTKPASETSDATLVFSRPASPDDKTLREIFLKIAQKSDMNENGKPKKEIFVLVGHGARSDLNDLYQTKELTSAAKYVQHKMKYADAFGVTAREDWPELMPDAVNSAADKIEESINMHNADHAVLVPAAGSGSGFDAVKQELDNRGISYVETEGTLPIGAKQFTQWALKNIIGSTVFILMEKPSENTITSTWGV